MVRANSEKTIHTAGKAVPPTVQGSSPLSAQTASANIPQKSQSKKPPDKSCACYDGRFSTRSVLKFLQYVSIPTILGLLDEISACHAARADLISDSLILSRKNRCEYKSTCLIHTAQPIHSKHYNINIRKGVKR